MAASTALLPLLLLLLLSARRCSCSQPAPNGVCTGQPHSTTMARGGPAHGHDDDDIGIGGKATPGSTAAAAAALQRTFEAKAQVVAHATKEEEHVAKATRAAVDKVRETEVTNTRVPSAIQIGQQHQSKLVAPVRRRRRKRTPAPPAVAAAAAR